MLEVAADTAVALHQHVAAHEDRREHALAHRGLGIDHLGDHGLEHAGTLGVADEHEAAAVVELRQIRLQGLLHVGDPQRGIGLEVDPDVPGSPAPARVTCRYIGA